MYNVIPLLTPFNEIQQVDKLCSAIYEGLFETCDKKIIEKNYLSDKTFDGFMAKIEQLYLGNDMKQFSTYLMALLQTFDTKKDIFLSKETTFVVSSSIANSLRKYQSLRSAIALSLINYSFLVYDEICNSSLSIKYVSKDKIKEFVTKLRVNSYIFEQYSEDSVFEEQETNYLKILSRLMLAEAQELLYNNLLFTENSTSGFKNSVLSKIAMGCYDLYNNIKVCDSGPQLKLEFYNEINNKKNLFKALAQYHYLKELKEKSGFKFSENFYCRSVDLLKCLKNINFDAKATYMWHENTITFIDGIILDINKDIHYLLRENGTITFDSNLTNLESTILVTPKSFEFELSKTALIPDVPYYSFFKFMKDYSLQEKEIAKSYKSLITYNKNNITKLIESKGWQNVSCLYSSISINDYKQTKELVSTILPQKRNQIKILVNKSKNIQKVAEVEKYLVVGLKVDEQNLREFNSMNQNVLFHVPVLSINKLLAGLTNDSENSDNSIKLLVKILEQVQIYVSQLSTESQSIDLNELKLENYVNSNYPSCRYQPNFSYQKVFQECINLKYDSKYKQLLTDIDSFIIEISSSKYSTILPRDNILLFDENIANFNNAILSYQKISKSIQQGVHFYKQLEDALCL